MTINITISFDLEFDLRQSGICRPSQDDFEGLMWFEDFQSAQSAWSEVIEQFKGDWVSSALTIAEDDGFTLLVVDRQPQHQTHTPCGDGDTWERIIWQAAHDATPFVRRTNHLSDAGW